MSLQSERLLNHMLRLRLSHLPNCYEAIAEEASAKNLPYLDFLEQTLEAESQAKHTRNVRLKTQWAHFPYNKGLDQFDFAFQPSALNAAMAKSSTSSTRDALQQPAQTAVAPRLSQINQCLPASTTAKAIHYTLTLWRKFTRFRQFPQLELSTNLAENSVRGIAIGRRNWIHFGHQNAGPKIAAILSVIESCRRLQINPRLYLADILPGLPSKSMRSTQTLTPSAWNTAQPA
jgi:hypothetical protein